MTRGERRLCPVTARAPRAARPARVAHAGVLELDELGLLLDRELHELGLVQVVVLAAEVVAGADDGALAGSVARDAVVDRYPRLLGHGDLRDEMDLGRVVFFVVDRCHIQVMIESPLLFQGLVTDVDFDIMHKLAILRIPRVAPHFIFDRFHETVPTAEATDHLFRQHLVQVAYHSLLQDEIVDSARAFGAVCTSANVPARLAEVGWKKLAALGLLGPSLARLGGGLVS
eukprot:CAMPEP_0119524058 /NCGR_PEP_ID=MMETSP1344-20130328/39042_1 /TAXON_ID=236787 /ORGANISM="Florenciella parvula, Strain CCMP2471" /LENGTH=228 /DNA_ID=CAMNT_0007562471 /DNA_START=224 /DNA_END=907 /DNA_ORIENTATION=+